MPLHTSAVEAGVQLQSVPVCVLLPPCGCSAGRSPLEQQRRRRSPLKPVFRLIIQSLLV